MMNDGPTFLRLAGYASRRRLREPARATRSTRSTRSRSPRRTPLFGDAERAAVAVSVAAGALAVGALYLLLRAAFDRRVAAIGAFLLAVHPSALELTDLQSDALYLALFLASAALLWRAYAAASARLAFAAGLVAGFAYLTRPEGLGTLVVGVALCALEVARRHWSVSQAARVAGALVLGGVLVMSPYVAFLSARSGGLVLTGKKSVTGVLGLSAVRAWLSTGSPEYQPPKPLDPLLAERPDLVRPEKGVKPFRVAPVKRGFAKYPDALVRLGRSTRKALRPELLLLLALGLWSARGRPGPRGPLLRDLRRAVRVRAVRPGRELRLRVAPPRVPTGGARASATRRSVCSCSPTASAGCRAWARGWRRRAARAPARAGRGTRAGQGAAAGSDERAARAARRPVGARPGRARAGPGGRRDQAAGRLLRERALRGPAPRAARGAPAPVPAPRARALRGRGRERARGAPAHARRRRRRRSRPCTRSARARTPRSCSRCAGEARAPDRRRRESGRRHHQRARAARRPRASRRLRARRSSCRRARTRSARRSAWASRRAGSTSRARACRSRPRARCAWRSTSSRPTWCTCTARAPGFFLACAPRGGRLPAGGLHRSRLPLPGQAVRRARAGGAGRALRARARRRDGARLPLRLGPRRPLAPRAARRAADRDLQRHRPRRAAARDRHRSAFDRLPRPAQLPEGPASSWPRSPRASRARATGCA